MVFLIHTELRCTVNHTSDLVPYVVYCRTVPQDIFILKFRIIWMAGRWNCTERLPFNYRNYLIPNYTRECWGKRWGSGLRDQPTVQYSLSEVMRKWHMWSVYKIKSAIFFTESILALLPSPLNSESNPICHLLTLLGAKHILHVSRIGVKRGSEKIHYQLHKNIIYKFFTNSCNLYYLCV